jgi:catechol 2,3-dioxygenase-like lactoylglutathione lyase family enzyme
VPASIIVAADSANAAIQEGHMSDAKARKHPATAAKLPTRMHHHAFVVADQERTRHFYEDIVGLPLRATWIEKEHFNGEDLVFSHTFYGLADGSALAFFNFADKAIQARFNVGAQKNLCYHIALAVDEETQTQINARCEAAQVKTMLLDHGYCKSLYITDPDGLQVEFTVDAANVDEINDYQQRVARKSLDAWQSGDTRPNNNVRPHD